MQHSRSSDSGRWPLYHVAPTRCADGNARVKGAGPLSQKHVAEEQADDTHVLFQLSLDLVEANGQHEGWLDSVFAVASDVALNNVIPPT